MQSLIQRVGLQSSTMDNAHTAQRSACAPRQIKMNVNTPKPLENIQGKTSFWPKKKLETDKQRLWQKVHRLRQAHLKVAGLNQFYEHSAPFNTIVRDKY